MQGKITLDMHREYGTIRTNRERNMIDKISRKIRKEIVFLELAKRIGNDEIMMSGEKTTTTEIRSAIRKEISGSG